MSLSYQVSGKTAAGAPFALNGRDEFELDLRVVDGAELGARTKVQCVVRFDMTGWFNGVSLSGPGGPCGGGPGPGRGLRRPGEADGDREA